MEGNILTSSARGLVRVTPATATPDHALAATLSTPNAGQPTAFPTGTGVFPLTDSPSPGLTRAEGVESAFKVIPLRTSTGTYDLSVYGYQLCGGLWVRSLLYQAAVSCTTASSGAHADNGIATGDFVAESVTPDTDLPASMHETISVDAPAHFVCSSHGCPFLVFVASNGDARLLVGAQSW